MFKLIVCYFSSEWQPNYVHRRRDFWSAEELARPPSGQQPHLSISGLGHSPLTSGAQTDHSGRKSVVVSMRLCSETSGRIAFEKYCLLVYVSVGVFHEWILNLNECEHECEKMIFIIKVVTFLYMANVSCVFSYVLKTDVYVSVCVYVCGLMCLCVYERVCVWVGLCVCVCKCKKYA